VSAPTPPIQQALLALFVASNHRQKMADPPINVESPPESNHESRSAAPAAAAVPAPTTASPSAHRRVGSSNNLHGLTDKTTVVSDGSTQWKKERRDAWDWKNSLGVGSFGEVRWFLRFFSDRACGIRIRTLDPAVPKQMTFCQSGWTAYFSPGTFLAFFGVVIFRVSGFLRSWHGRSRFCPHPMHVFEFPTTRDARE
jgi:hypothetical protein